MATNEIKNTKDIDEDEMKTLATEQQQCFYEEMVDCLIYNINEHKYLKQNIGYAIYGPPKSFHDVKDTNEKENTCYYKTENLTKNLNDIDAADEVGYDGEAKKNIEKIYNKICDLTIKDNPSEPIYFGIVYNVIYPVEITAKSEKEETDKTAKVETKAEKNKSKETKDEKMLIVLPVCVFKVKKCIDKNLTTTKNAKEKNITAEMQDDAWYIDNNARVYTNWTDYIENNTLPECTMVFPKDGSYQANPEYPIMEDYSTVWLETGKSPASKWTKKLCDAGDTASSIVGIGVTGLGIASMFTPIGPIVAVSGCIAAGVAGTWSLGRNTQQLIDRSAHEESINPFDKEAFPHYLGIAATVVGLGAMGGAMLLSTVAARGMTINTVTRVAFNTVQGGNIIINGFGVIYQGYNIYNKYMSNEEITIGEALNFATHLMFFCGSVIKVQFASDIIENSQGKVMRDYKESLSSKRLRKNYNRAMRKAANNSNNNGCKMAENAEVIRYIKHRQELIQNQPVNGNSQQSKNDPRNISWSFDQGKLKVNTVILLDPFKFVTQLINQGIFMPETNQNTSFDSCNSSNDFNIEQLSKVLAELLSKFYNDYPQSTKKSNLPDFTQFIQELNSLNIDAEYLKKLFDIAVKLMKRSKNCEEFLQKVLMFVWQYCKANLKQWGLSVSHFVGSASSSTVLKKIIIAIFEAIDMIIDNLYSAFEIYNNSSHEHYNNEKNKFI
ncbi:hypothetical protein PUN28_003907 [Cardiocondyla obscurior]|uniref:DUF4781 domain-containing protein n=1 Tax=Cardiocondyla obscurior TaxID=286306 RepID=A0AAW2GPD5_9HYME